MKLVRDNIPEIVERSGLWCLCRKVKSIDEHMSWLREKIIEESEEFIDDPSYEEAADMLEVVRAFCAVQALDFDVVVKTADTKLSESGGFTKGIILESVGEDK